MSQSLQVGDRIPDFSLPDADGKEVSSKDLIGEKPLVLYFYPKDETPGCTAQACSFRDSYEDFVELGARVIGVSSDSTASHQKFVKKHGLPFSVLSDRGGKLRQLFAVPKTLGFLPGRVTYVIDKKGIIQSIFNSQIQAKRHVAEALQALKTLEA
jgi:thioredoxin-dependent peroxiredoxin